MFLVNPHIATTLTGTSTIPKCHQNGNILQDDPPQIDKHKRHSDQRDHLTRVDGAILPRAALILWSILHNVGRPLQPVGGHEKELDKWK